GRPTSCPSSRHEIVRPLPGRARARSRYVVQSRFSRCASRVGAVLRWGVAVEALSGRWFGRASWAHAFVDGILVVAVPRRAGGGGGGGGCGPGAGGGGGGEGGGGGRAGLGGAGGPPPSPRAQHATGTWASRCWRPPFASASSRFCWRAGWARVLRHVFRVPAI